MNNNYGNSENKYELQDFIYGNKMLGKVKPKPTNDKPKLEPEKIVDLGPFELNNEEIYSLQLLALETNDKEWFEALGNQMK